MKKQHGFQPEIITDSTNINIGQQITSNKLTKKEFSIYEKFLPSEAGTLTLWHLKYA